MPLANESATAFKPEKAIKDQSATEMASITYDASEYGLGTLRIEQDKDFKPCKLADIKDDELQLFLSQLYDKD